ncbi:hormogonium polysaccharide biosynthesis protein HpsA [Sphaerospermopsis sp. LEGE 08334]|uniref:hormogonium polysaccharide biosynthesis protein HpsA n=1 Tax=Sphaerospermopsis sp. LEGE 08334 TaxID=1828651 RepID=UPI001D132ED9|nr:hormogonium polysaccharide biosynthesis protein HpsA [Sphaerospermopsis sp. LEGE 08334]
MTKTYQPTKVIIRIAKKMILKCSRAIKSRAIKKTISRLLKAIFGNKKRRNSTNSGFVLPTVAMVSMVVVLLTLAIMIRSFERSKHASNVRVNQTVINAAIPAIDRGRAKINKLFQDQRISRSLPSDQDLDQLLTEHINEYTFGDETPLELNINNNQPLKTAWKYPVDTNNNGKFDSYTLYAIYYRNPPKNNDNNQYIRTRNTLEARSTPINHSDLTSKCHPIFGTNPKLVDINGWFKMGGKMKKALFVYTTTFPITSTNNITSDQAKNYEIYQGTQSFSALEYQQDREQILPTNHAIIYEDDLEITPNEDFKINGRIFTNGNFLTGGKSAHVRLYQVSSPDSCFYKADNSKIIVGGNLGAGGFTDDSDLVTATTVDLFKDKNTNPENVTGYNPQITTNKSGTNAPKNLAYNSLAYAKRINKLVNAQFANSLTTDPQEVKDGIEKQQRQLDTGYTTDQYDNIRRHQLELYFRRRTRRVPFAEVAFGDEQKDANSGGKLQGSGDTLRPIDKWSYPYDSDGITGSGYSQITLNITGSSLKPLATEPIDKLQKELANVEQYLGDRTIVANNLPEQWWDKETNQFRGANIDDTQELEGINWDLSHKPTPRTRRTSLQILADLAATERDGDWEYAAAQVPKNREQENLVGGLRVVTGAGIYLPRNDTANSTNFTAASTKIWSDMLPVPKEQAQPPTSTTINPYSIYDSSLNFHLPQMLGSDITTPYLKMRATVVYHYKSANYSQKHPRPLACISSFYIPTNSTTAKNIRTLPDALGIEKDVNGLSNNGIVYTPPNKSASSYNNLLNYQASLQYPNGRWVNEPLKKALGKTESDRTISEHSAIDAALCALQIMDGSISPVTATPPIPHGAIKEIAFLDSRQVKANQTSSLDADLSYNLPLEDRQPLEIRTTVIDLNQLRTTPIGSEYLLPNSGIIYATRDDALADMSAGISSAGTSAAAKLESPVDYKLDSTRRPNGIMIMTSDGSATKLFRGTNNTYIRGAKGLIFASNLPVYMKGDFNKHTQTEFTTGLASDWSNFYTRNQANNNFACRPGDPKRPNCHSGDEWRNAVVLADSITLLSDNFRFGFRDEGDYDWNNNIGDSASLASRPVHFKYNAYAPTVTKNYNSGGIPNVDLDPNTSGIQGSSYFHNFVTPIVKQIQAREFLFEVCAVSDIEVCNNDPKQWVITNVPYHNYDGQGQNNWRNGGGNIEGLSMSAIKTGSLGNANKPSNGWDDQNLPKRIAFKRDIDTGELITPLAIYGVNDKNKIEAFPVSGSTLPRLAKDEKGNTFLIPWLKVDENGNWQPVLQIKQPFATPDDPNNTNSITTGSHNYWLQVATENTFNLIIATGDNPGRPTEDNGGLPNLVRFLENWHPGGNAIPMKINGAFIQMKRSAYATGTYSTAINTQSSEFLYKISLNNGMSSGHLPPKREWSYDVGILSQVPDLFSQKLVTMSNNLPNEYFREVSRDDDWIETLLCAKTTTKIYAVDQDQRPACN